jgi:hypothetical protein
MMRKWKIEEDGSGDDGDEGSGGSGSEASGGASSSSGGGGDGSGEESASGDEGGGSDGEGGSRKRARRPKARSGASQRAPVDEERLRELYAQYKVEGVACSTV